MRAPKEREPQQWKRIAARLGEGFSEEQLKRCVDSARGDEFYVKQGYHRRPEVIWRNAERVNALLETWGRKPPL